MRERQARARGERRVDREALPVVDAQRARDFEVWAAGLDAAIEEIRRTEGFDGRHVTWQTLGSILPPDPTPRPAPVVVTPAPRLLVMSPRKLAAGSAHGGRISARAARFQALAALDVGRLTSVTLTEVAHAR